MQDTYNIINTNSEAIYREKGSKFIAKSYYVEDKDEAEAIVKQLRKEFHDARHWCYAYMIGKDYSVERQNDDGEPSGTAGKPIYGQIKSLALTNVLVVVIRYFGGTLLGTSGLIKAYKTSTQDVLEESGITTKEIVKYVTINFGFSKTKQVMQLINKHKLKIDKQEYTDMCSITFEVPISRYESVKQIFIKNLIDTK
jgi:uncharacterized YigZ family protein